MTASKAQLRAQAKYDKDNTLQFKLKLNKKTDADIIAYLNNCDNKQGYIKELIRLNILQDTVKIILDKCDCAEKSGYNFITDSDIIDILEECKLKGIKTTRKELEKIIFSD